MPNTSCGPDRVALEHHADVALERRDIHARASVGNGHIPDSDAAAGWPFEPGNATQSRRLAATRGAEQGEEAAARDAERDPVHGRLVAEAFDQSLHLHVAGGMFCALHNSSGERLAAGDAPERDDADEQHDRLRN